MRQHLLVAMTARRLFRGYQAKHMPCPEWPESQVPLAECDPRLRSYLPQLQQQLERLLSRVLAAPGCPSSTACQQSHPPSRVRQLDRHSTPVQRAAEGQDLGNAGASGLQVAAVGERQEEGGVHEQEQHERVAHTRQQQLPGLPMELRSGRVGCICEQALCRGVCARPLRPTCAAPR